MTDSLKTLKLLGAKRALLEGRPGALHSGVQLPRAEGRTAEDQAVGTPPRDVFRAGAAIHNP